MNLISIGVGDHCFGDLGSSNFHCILGSCVGLLYFNKNTIGITHGRLPKEITKQIEEALQNITNHNIYLYGGMSGQIGDMNINAARNALKNVRYTNNTGNSVKIVTTDGTIKISIIKDTRGN